MKTHFCLTKYILNSFNEKEYVIFALSVIFVTLFSSCNQSTAIKKKSEKLNNNNVLQKELRKQDIHIPNKPKDTVLTSDTRFSIKNGIFFYKDSIFTGILKKHYPRAKMTTYTSVYKGKRDGVYSSFYKNGQPYEIKEYQNNRATGRHLMYWENGNLKASYYYEDGKMEGTQKRWYNDGNQYTMFNYINGKREGVQKAWRTYGKLYINNEIVNGKIYGLNRASLCYKVKDEKPIILGYVKAATDDEK